MPRPPRSFALGLALAALALAGCGGSDDEGASGTTVEPSTETGATDDRRLSAASWATYLEARDRARAVNAKATAAFRECRDVVIDAADTDAVKSCLGDSTTAVVTEGEEALATLSSFEDEVGGACAAELTDLQGYLRLYTASVQSLGTAVDEGDVASVQSSIDEAADALARERETSAPFEAACKPA